MSLPRLPLEVGRIIVLLGLGMLTGPLGSARAVAESRLDHQELWLPTLGLTLLAVVFVVIALVGRLRDDGLVEQPAGLLAVEGALAGALALAPSVLWVLLLGVGHPLVSAVLQGILQPLAGVWLAVVLLTWVRRRSALKASGRHTIFT